MIFRKSLLATAAGLLIATASCSFTSNDPNPDKDKLLVDVISYVLDRMHFNKVELNDQFSEAVFDRYIDNLDPRRRFFLQSDIEEFRQYRTQLDDQLKAKDISLFDLTYNRLMQRMDESEAYYKAATDTPFDFTVQEDINTDYENTEFAATPQELQNRWRQQLKLSTLVGLYDSLEDQRLALENDPNAETKTEAELEEKSRESTREALAESYDFYDDMRREDWFSMFMNSILAQYDPHTSYFAPENKERFDQQMSGKLEGIGARLQKKMDNIKIMEIISGGPAWQSEELEVGDEITAVRQEDEEEAVSIVGMRLGDAVSLIKGPKGTKVNLTVKKVDGRKEIYTITRDVVELEETYVKSSMLDKGDAKYGVINLPKFYVDLSDYSSRNAATDVEQEIKRLKAEGMEGLIIDLRNNGGGSLRTVVDIMGLFIDKGPVVQVGMSNGKREVLEDEDKKIVWDGPLVILVNELSASASEILAAAVQDYERGVIIGSEQTFGKGTVQNVWDLNRWVRNSDVGDLGGIKVTTQKFYRVDGNSTQLEGVKSDVVVPDRYSYITIGERDEENPLPYDRIESAKYRKWDRSINLKQTIAASKARLAQNDQFKLIDENAKWLKNRSEDDVYPLSLAAYGAKMKQIDEESERYSKLSDYETNLDYKSLPYEVALMDQDSTLRKKRERWHKSLSKDPYMEEAVNVLGDIQTGNITLGSAIRKKD